MNIDIRPLTADDAPQLVRCFERCYGSTYPNETFYDSESIADLVDNGVLKSVVAVSADGDIVGHTGLTLRNPDASIVEAGNTVVDPDCRGEGVLGRMGSALAELCGECGIVGYVHYPTTAHDVMQKRSVTDGGVETGVMLGYVPADTDYREIDQGPGRIAATIVYQPFAEARPLNVYVPHRYESLLGRLYAQMVLRRERLHSSDRSQRQAQRSTEATSVNSPRRSLLNVQIQRAGADLAAVVGRLMEADCAEITHVDLTLDEPGIDRAVDDLAKLGFVYCGLLPGFARSDVLRLQCLRDQLPAVFAPELVNPGARTILALINSECPNPASGEVQPGA